MIETESKEQFVGAGESETDYLEAINMLTSPENDNFETGLRSLGKFGVTKLAQAR